MDIAGLQMVSEKMRVVLGIIFILFIVCFIAIVVEETFLGGRRKRKALKAALVREANRCRDDSTSDPARRN